MVKYHAVADALAVVYSALGDTTRRGIVERLAHAGAILLGKSNTPEFTLAGYSGISTTWNLIYGITRNPYNNMHSSAGSSG